MPLRWVCKSQRSIFAHSDAEPTGWRECGFTVYNGGRLALSHCLVCWSDVHEKSIAKSTSLFGSRLGDLSCLMGDIEERPWRTDGNCSWLRSLHRSTSASTPHVSSHVGAIFKHVSGENVPSDSWRRKI